MVAVGSLRGDFIGGSVGISKALNEKIFTFEGFPDGFYGFSPMPSSLLW
jgi:hypothetical protein